MRSDGLWSACVVAPVVTNGFFKRGFACAVAEVPATRSFVLGAPEQLGAVGTGNLERFETLSFVV